MWDCEAIVRGGLLLLLLLFRIRFGVALIGNGTVEKSDEHRIPSECELKAIQSNLLR